MVACFFSVKLCCFVHQEYSFKQCVYKQRKDRCQKNFFWPSRPSTQATHVTVWLAGLRLQIGLATASKTAAKKIANT